MPKPTKSDPVPAPSTVSAPGADRGIQPSEPWPAPGPHPGGRPTKRTPEARSRVLVAIRAGMTLKRAASAAGMAYDTLNEWRLADAEFSEAVKKAEDGFILSNLSIIINARAKHWPAAAWLLERRFPEEFGRQRLEITGAGGGPVISTAVDLSHLTTDELRTLRDIHRRIRRSALAGDDRDGTGKT